MKNDCSFFTAPFFGNLYCLLDDSYTTLRLSVFFTDYAAKFALDEVDGTINFSAAEVEYTRAFQRSNEGGIIGGSKTTVSVTAASDEAGNDDTVYFIKLDRLTVDLYILDTVADFLRCMVIGAGVTVSGDRPRAVK